MQVCNHVGMELADPSRRDEADATAIVDEVKEYVRQHMPSVDHRKPAIVEKCIYTVSS